MKKTLSFDTNWTLSSSTTIRVAAVTAIAAIAASVLALKDAKFSKPIRSRFSLASLLPDYNQDNHSDKPIFVPGLRNLGNNCFLNVVLQALASCVCFQSFLDDVIAEYGTDEKLVENMPLVFSLASLLQELSSVSAQKVVLSPRQLMRAISSYIPNFDLTSQQDAAEAFVHLLGTLKEEVGDGVAE